jgi:hypothetical protein
MPKDPNSKQLRIGPITGADEVNDTADGLQAVPVPNISVSVSAGDETVGAEDFLLTPNKPQPVSHFQAIPQVSPEAAQMAAPPVNAQGEQPMSMAELQEVVLTDSSYETPDPNPISDTVKKLIVQVDMQRMQNPNPKRRFEIRTRSGRLVAVREDW